VPLHWEASLPSPLSRSPVGSSVSESARNFYKFSRARPEWSHLCDGAFVCFLNGVRSLARDGTRNQALNHCYQSRRSEGLLEAVYFSIENIVSSIFGEITRNHDHWQFRPYCLDTSDKIQSVKVWQDHVCDDKFAVKAAKYGERFDSIASFHHFIAIAAQGLGKMGAAYGVVFD
jgi:hypothetical protein